MIKDKTTQQSKALAGRNTKKLSFTASNRLLAYRLQIAWRRLIGMSVALFLRRTILLKAFILLCAAIVSGVILVRLLFSDEGIVVDDISQARPELVLSVIDEL